MRELFRTSHETQKLVALFAEMSTEQMLTFEDASKLVGFRVHSLLPAYHSARRIVTRDKRVIIEGIKGIGFKRLNGVGMVMRGGRILRSVRRHCRKGSTEMQIALQQNLDRNDALKASELFNRFRLGADIAANPSSNRQLIEAPPLA